MVRKAIIVIDMLNDFITGSLKCDRAEHIIPNIKRLIEESRRRDVPVIYSNDAHLPGDADIKIWGPHALKGTKGAEVIPDLKPAAKDYVMEKRTYSAFFETGLELLLRDLNVDTIVITGLHTNCCDRHTAADAFARRFNIIVAREAVEAFTDKENEEGIEYLEKMYGAEIKSVDDIIKGLG